MLANFGRNKEVRSRYNRQLQPWGTVAAPPCMEQVKGPPIPTRIGQYYETPRPHPWRPTLGYETIQVMPLPSTPITSEFMNPCFAPNGMSTEPLKFPNLVTGFERNPAHAARAALYTRYTPYEWAQASLSTFSESDTNRNYSERLRCDAVRVMRETDEKTSQGQRDAGRRIGERITDTTFWRNEVSTELDRLVSETALFADTRRLLAKTLQDLEGPLHIAQECLYQRESRMGIDLVHDEVEQALLKEVEGLRSWKEKISTMDAKVLAQLVNNRASQNELEKDLRFKESALGIDGMCHQLNNNSRGITYYGGIERYDPAVTTTESWADYSSHVVQKSQGERARSQQLRSDTDNLINQCAQQVWDAWSFTNNALARRSAETLETKNKLQLHLHKTQQEVFDVEKHIELLRKAILDKEAPMKVAQTRLEARSHRPNLELCKDQAQNRLVKEVFDMQDSIDLLHRKLQETEAQHQQLLRTRSNLETDLQSKVNSLFIDREKCMGMRRAFPITATIKY